MKIERNIKDTTKFSAVCVGEVIREPFSDDLWLVTHIFYSDIGTRNAVSLVNTGKTDMFRMFEENEDVIVVDATLVTNE